MKVSLLTAAVLLAFCINSHFAFTQSLETNTSTCRYDDGNGCAGEWAGMYDTTSGWYNTSMSQQPDNSLFVSKLDVHRDFYTQEILRSSLCTTCPGSAPLEM